MDYLIWKVCLCFYYFIVMRKIININGNEQVFKYMVEYLNAGDISDGQDIKWLASDRDNIHLFEGGIKIYKDKNEWYSVDRSNMINDYIPEKVDVSTIRIYLPHHSVDTYVKNIKYVVTANTWINGKTINLGSFVFKHIDTIAVTETINNGEILYNEYIDMDVINPYYIAYSDDWDLFRKKVCNEPEYVNNTGSLLNVSLYIVEEYEDKYLIKDNWIGGYTSFNISEDIKDFMYLSISSNIDPLGWKFDLTFNKQYDWLLTYLYETYGLNNISHNDIKYEIVLKSNDAIIPGPILGYNDRKQIMSWDFIKNFKNIDNINRTGFYEVFNSWNTFEEGWFVVGSLNINKDNEEIISIVSNPIPLTQEIFKYFVKSDRILTQLINPVDMEFINYNVINKIENKIIQLERPENSKSNIIQPVFFKVKDTEKLTLHPAVTENICINLDNYKSKVKNFKLQIEGCIFDQIGVNQYGVLFKINGSVLPNEIKEGTYYVLNEDSILVTTGKYKYVV